MWDNFKTTRSKTINLIACLIATFSKWNAIKSNQNNLRVILKIKLFRKIRDNIPRGNFRKLYVRKNVITHREEEDSVPSSNAIAGNVERPRRTKTRVGPSSDQRRNNTDRVGPSAWRELLRVWPSHLWGVCAASSVTTRRPQVLYLLFTFSLGSFHFFYLLEIGRCRIFANRTHAPIFFVKSENSPWFSSVSTINFSIVLQCY